MKTLIAYFSHTAGNTKRIAEKIQEAIGGDIVRIEPASAYSDDYDKVVSQAQEEIKRGHMSKLKPLDIEVKSYDRIIAGTPTWWYKMAPSLLSFLFAGDLSGKTVIPFITHAGWPGTVIKDMTAVAEKNGAEVKNGHEFKFSFDKRHFDQMITPEKELTEWIESLK